MSGNVDATLCGAIISCHHDWYRATTREERGEAIRSMLDFTGMLIAPDATQLQHVNESLRHPALRQAFVRGVWLRLPYLRSDQQEKARISAFVSAQIDQGLTLTKQ